MSAGGIGLLLGFGFVLLIVGLMGSCVWRGLNQPTEAAHSIRYAQCERELKPKLEQCLKGPQSGWEACGQAYMRELESCVK